MVYLPQLMAGGAQQDLIPTWKSRIVKQLGTEKRVTAFYSFILKCSSFEMSTAAARGVKHQLVKLNRFAFFNPNKE